MSNKEKDTTPATAEQVYVAPETQVTQQEVVKVAAQAVAAVIPEPEHPDEVLRELISKKNEDVKIVVALFEERLDSYLVAMAPGKPISEEEGTVMQRHLWTTLDKMLELDAPRFNAVMDMTLAKINEHRNGCFAMVYIRRFFENLAIALGGEKRRVCFDMYLDLLIAFAKLKDKSRVMQHVDLSAVASEFDSQEKQTRILSYFGSFS